MRKLFILSLVLLAAGCYNAPQPQPLERTGRRIEIEIERPDAPILVPPDVDIRIEKHRRHKGVDINIQRTAEQEKTAEK